MKSVCIGCNQTGEYTSDVKPRWCRCRGVGGPYHAPKGHVYLFLFMTPEQKADRDATLAIKNEYIDARDALIHARWTDGGRRRSSRARVLVAATSRFRKATRGLDKLQASCSHDERSVYQSNVCARCAAVLAETEAV